MRLLLDTIALLWWLTHDPRLSNKARSAIANTDNAVFVSAASAWEIAIKQRIGKRPALEDVAQRYSELIAADCFAHLPMTTAHALRAGGYALDNRDPFDRMLAAQSELEALELVTLDPLLAQFGCKTFW